MLGNCYLWYYIISLLFHVTFTWLIYQESHDLNRVGKSESRRVGESESRRLEKSAVGKFVIKNTLVNSDFSEPVGDARLVGFE